ncbi:MAG: cytochrome C oxidase subunit IV family protein [Gammaproteobacteria bacterium]|nr:cytochrome C oxidase subunit IV family protein [Gammaproteobacteria bacterium]MDH5239320.1 cytochrome C oxidase subunit IV family protein [Gammaproteobacteria bacterium]MDH5260639.1 cytochrome C oxidase subunit IV family protein [Gammaproteobacteria bacterium]MDH5583591.1 cytochrome C oxidase subunit IV family protein [Gammaproteobacteria bacterium]
MATEGTQHPLKIYWIMWAALFVLSTFSYLTDFMDDGALRTTLILTFMLAKAGGIVWIFMHMGWERLALKLAILGPPVAILVLIGMMSLEGEYVEDSRIDNYGESTFVPETPGH